MSPVRNKSPHLPAERHINAEKLENSWVNSRVLCWEELFEGVGINQRLYNFPICQNYQT